MGTTDGAMARAVPADLSNLLEQLHCLEAENRLLRRLARHVQAHSAERERHRRRLAILEHLTTSASWEWIAAEARSELSDGMRRLLGIAADAPPPPLRRVLHLLERSERHRALMQLRRLADGIACVQDYALREPGLRLRVAGLVEFDEHGQLARLCFLCQCHAAQDSVPPQPAGPASAPHHPTPARNRQ